MNIDGKISPIPVLTDSRIPIPFCNTNFSLTDFGVESISELAEVVGTNIAQAGIDWVLTELGIKVNNNMTKIFVVIAFLIQTLCANSIYA